jgi:hypothetical protein
MGERERKTLTTRLGFHERRREDFQKPSFLSVLRRKRREHLTSPFLALSRGGGEKFQTVFRD